jgi:hypothetical protein
LLVSIDLSVPFGEKLVLFKVWWFLNLARLKGVQLFHVVRSIDGCFVDISTNDDDGSNIDGEQ